MRYLLVTALVAVCWSALPVAQAQVLDEIVAIVDDEIVLRSEIDALVASFLQQNQVPYDDLYWHDALNQVIDQKVMSIHAARDTTLRITEDELDQQMDQRLRQQAAQVGGEARLEELYGKPMVEIKADLREDFRAQIQAQRLQQQRMAQIRVTPTEVRAWFARIPTDSLPEWPEVVRVSHIVRYPAITDAARADAMEIITTLRDSVLNGGSFEELASLFTDDPGSAETGGRYQGTRLNELVPEFAAVAAREPIGQVSRIFETQFGLHFLRVNDRVGDVVDYNHILIEFDKTKSDPQPAIDFLAQLRDSILVHDMPFELMARRHSEEPMSSTQGGRVTNPQTGERDLVLDALGPRWHRTLGAIQVGEISEPAEAELLSGDLAYHIVRLSRRVPTHIVNLETDYEIIENFALQEKRTREMRTWLDRLRESVYIELRGKALTQDAAEEGS